MFCLLSSGMFSVFSSLLLRSPRCGPPKMRQSGTRSETCWVHLEHAESQKEIVVFKSKFVLLFSRKSRTTNCCFDKIKNIQQVRGPL